MQLERLRLMAKALPVRAEGVMYCSATCPSHGFAREASSCRLTSSSVHTSYEVVFRLAAAWRLITRCFRSCVKQDTSVPWRRSCSARCST